VTSRPEAHPALDPATFDLDVRVQDDLFRHVNGRWLDETDIPDDKPIVGAFRDLADDAELAVRQIITTISPDSTDPDESKIAGLFASFMNEEAIEAADATPLAPMLAQVASLTSFDDLQALSGRLSRAGVGSLVDADVESDPGNPSRMVLFVGQSGIGLPDEAYYRDDEHADTRQKYLEHVTDTAIAGCHWDRVRRRDLRQMYNPMSLADIDRDAASLALPGFFAAAGIEESALAELVNAQPSFFTEVAEVVTAHPLSSWQSWLRWNIVRSFSPYLSKRFVDVNFAFYGTVLTGTPQNKERWKRGVALVEGSMGEAVGRIYVQRHFSPVAKQRMDELVGYLIEGYRRSITDLEWMTDVTKAKALEKLAKFRPKIGFPVRWRDYSALSIDPSDLIANVRAVREFSVDWALSKVGRPVDRDEWLMTPQTVNAYYHPLQRARRRRRQLRRNRGGDRPRDRSRFRRQGLHLRR
jgi:putative endopeptidase